MQYKNKRLGNKLPEESHGDSPLGLFQNQEESITGQEPSFRGFKARRGTGLGNCVVLSVL